MTTYRVTQIGIDLIKKWEGLRLKAYKDVVGVWTIGYGTTKIDGNPVKSGMVITEAEAERLLMLGVQRHIDGAMEGVDPEEPMNQNQVDALASFVYNVGVGAFQKSTLKKLINEGRFAEAGLQFARWNKAGGKVLAGLTRRRSDEAKLWNTRP